MIEFCCGSTLFLGLQFPLLFPFRLKVRKREEGSRASSSKKCQKTTLRTRTVKIRRALPVDLRPRLQSHLFVLETIISSSSPSSEIAHFTLLYHTLVQDGSLASGLYTEIYVPWKHQHVELRTGCKLQRLPLQTRLLPRLFQRFVENQNIGHLLKNSIGDQLVVAADVRPKRFRTKWQRVVYDGPTARKDAEASERERWIPASGKLAQVDGHANGKTDPGKPEQHSVARGWSPCRNSQVESSVCAKIPWLAYFVTRRQFSSTLATADGVFASSVF